MSETHYISDESDLRKYRTEIPNLIDDLGLSPHAFRLYVHMKRVCGAESNGRCYQGTRTLAKACKMSVGKVSEAKKELKAFKLIAVQAFPASENRPEEVRILDIWLANFKRYAGSATRSQYEHPPSDSEHPRSHTEQKKEPSKKEPSKKWEQESKEERKATGAARRLAQMREVFGKEMT